MHILFSVSLKWKLHFEFVLSVDKNEESKSDSIENSNQEIENKENEDDKKQWKAPSKLDIETLVWDLPITLYPSNPNQLSQALGLSESRAHHLSSSGS